MKMTTKPVIAPSTEDALSRRGFFMKLGILFNGFAAMVLAVPVVGFLLSSVTRGGANGYLSWVPLGRIDEFPEGETRLATFRNPNVMPTDGKTVDTACWVRRVAGEKFQVFAIISGARSAGFPNLGYSCVLVTVELTTVTAGGRQDRRSAGCSNIPTKLRTAW
jgi:hypothetical protein